MWVQKFLVYMKSKFNGFKRVDLTLIKFTMQNTC